jgi:hypothetical protein
MTIYIRTFYNYYYTLNSFYSLHHSKATPNTYTHAMCDPQTSDEIWAFYQCGCKTPAQPCEKYSANLDYCLETRHQVRGQKPHRANMAKCMWHVANEAWKTDDF